MSRKKLIRRSDVPYHLTARCNNQERFHCPLDKVWKIFLSHCFEFIITGRLEVHAFTLMPNHFHLIATAPSEDIGVVMRDFMRSVTRSINLVSGRTGRVFGARYHWTLVDSTQYFGHALKYVYRNPVKAGFYEKAEDYPFSTLGGTVGIQPLPFPLHYPFQLGELYQIPAESTAGFLDWINRPFQNEAEETIRKALKRTQFESIKSGSARSREVLKTALL